MVRWERDAWGCPCWKEYYYEEFKNASSLCASCGGPNKWGESPATDPDELTGAEWAGESFHSVGHSLIHVVERLQLC